MDRVDQARADIGELIGDPALTYRQRVQALAMAAENLLEPPLVSSACMAAIDAGIVCDMGEGHAPYRPRYTLPDYQALVANGSEFLELPAPSTFDDATTLLLAAYANVPSITGYPVWFGDLDAVLAPFADELDDDDLRAALRRFWILLDRLFPDAFAHANLGPADSRLAREVLAIHRDARQVVPNLTLKVDPEATPDALVLEAMRTVAAVGQPHVVNHPMMVADLGERYGVVSCYNSLPVGGGSHTLVRLNLHAAAQAHTGPATTFVTTTLPVYAELAAELIESRVRFLVEAAGFFDHSWLVAEGLLSLDRFTAMFGVFGLAECVAHLRAGLDGRYGHDAAANELAHEIVAAVAALVAERPMAYCEATAGRALPHSQAGLDSDEGVTAGARIPVGEEPDVYQHLRVVAPNHRHFASGVSDIVRLDDTLADNPQAAVDITAGALAMGMRDVTFEVDGGEFVRVTGYLVRRADLAHLAASPDHGVRHSSTVLGAASFTNAALDTRTVQRVRSHERDARPRR
ncbi:MAG: YjjI family glycine radical enzyme [Actinomycetota bacterium]